MAKNKQEIKPNKRFGVIVIILFGLLAVVAARLFVIYIFDGDRYAQAAQSQSEQDLSTIPAKRGDITDRNGMVLATSNITYNLILDPKVILSKPERFLEPTVDAIERNFGFSKEEITARINENPDRSYIVLKKNLDFTEVEEFMKEKDENLNIAGIWLENNSQRKYAYGSLASSVIGFMSGGSGLYGLELSYDDVLTGTDGREFTYINSDNVLETERIEAENGCTIRSTIDVNIQEIVEEKIEEFKSHEKCGTVACIIQNPNTGEIYAMADSGNFDCNDPYDLSAYFKKKDLEKLSDEEVTSTLSSLWTNWCISQSYEPGSTFKPFTLTAGLEEKAVTMEDDFYCDGSIEFQDDTVKCHNVDGHGALDTKHALAESCNVALMTMAERIGVKNFCKYQQRFGFGKYTGIDLPSEISCKSLLYTEENMKEIDLATNSFGQNFNLSMIQLSSAFCSIVNGGYLYKPYVVKGIYSDTGELIQSTDKTLVSRVASRETCDKVRECMRAVVAEGTGDYANVKGYVISGKTGTAEKMGRTEGNYLVSFIGFAPYDNPEVVCYVCIDQPESADEHGVSSHLFNLIMADVLPYMNIKTADQDTDPAEEITSQTTFYTWEEVHPEWEDQKVDKYEEYSKKDEKSKEETQDDGSDEEYDEENEEYDEDAPYDEGAEDEEYIGEDEEEIDE